MMPEISLAGVLPVAAIAFLMPLVLGLMPSLRLPSVVLEIVAGIVIGPAVLGFVEVDLPLQVLALLGLAFLLFLAGLDIDFDHLRGARLRSAAAGFVISLAVALGIGLGLHAAGLIQAPLLVAVILSSTSLGIVIPVLADAGQSNTTLGNSHPFISAHAGKSTGRIVSIPGALFTQVRGAPLLRCSNPGSCMYTGKRG